MNIAVLGTLAAKSVDMAPTENIELTCLSMPTITPDTSVVAETPVTAEPDSGLTCLSMPTIAPGTELAHKVTYDGNGNDGGAVPTDANYYASGETVTVLGNTGTLTKTDYTWSCWNTQADGGGTDYDADETFAMPAEAETLYAKWTEA